MYLETCNTELATRDTQLEKDFLWKIKTGRILKQGLPKQTTIKNLLCKKHSFIFPNGE
jgi:hypothetical protein